MLLFILFCLTIFWIWINTGKASRSCTEPPELFGKLPIVGHGLKFIGDRRHTFKAMKNLSRETLERGNIVTCYLGFSKSYVITDADDCAYVSNMCLEKPSYYLFAKPLLGNGLTIAEVPLWKVHRKHLNPVFKQQTLNSFLKVFNGQATRLVKDFREHAGCASFNHETYIIINNFESICRTTFGIDQDEFGGLQKQYLDGVKELMDIFSKRFQKFWLHSDFVFSFSNLKRRQDLVLRRIQQFTHGMLNKKRTEMVQNGDLSESDEFQSFLSLILDVATQTGIYTDEDIVSEINTIVAAGFDTLTCTVTVALMMLGTYPDVQEKAYHEIKSIFTENPNRGVEKDDFSKLKYLEAVLKETLRLYPVAPVVSRYLDKDIELKNYRLKGGHPVWICYWGLHRHPAWGPDVDQFNPDRWLDLATLPKDPKYFAGFSLGRRGCIGKTYAMMYMKTLLVHILRSYKLDSDITKLQLEVDVLLRPSCGQNISIEERL